jgi:integrase
MARSLDPARRCKPVAEWPALDRAVWARALEPYDPLDDEVGYAGRWKPGTIGAIENGYGRWLTWLELEGQLDPAVEPGERATEARVRAYLASLEAAGLADYSRALRLQQLGNALKAMNPAMDMRWIQRASSRIHGSARPVREVVGRLRPAQEVERLGLDMMHAADHHPFRTASERAVLYRDGLLVAFLVHRPCRMANLASIDVGGRLHRRGEAWWVAFAADETKGAADLIFPWPEDLTPALERYLAVHRPVLLQGARDPAKPVNVLWVALGGRAMGKAAIQTQVRSRTEDQFGKSIFPHAFRHLAATTIATADPANTEDASKMLGHRDKKTTEEHYIRSDMMHAGRRLQAVVKLQRGKGRKRRTRAVREPDGD